MRMTMPAKRAKWKKGERIDRRPPVNSTTPAGLQDALTLEGLAPRGRYCRRNCQTHIPGASLQGFPPPGTPRRELRGNVLAHHHHQQQPIWIGSHRVPVVLVEPGWRSEECGAIFRSGAEACLLHIRGAPSGVFVRCEGETWLLGG